jgi:hypothetical protein
MVVVVVVMMMIMMMMMMTMTTTTIVMTMKMIIERKKSLIIPRVFIVCMRKFVYDMFPFKWALFREAMKMVSIVRFELLSALFVRI